MQEKTKKRRIVFLVLTVLILLLIWGQSALPVRFSAAESGWLRETVVNPLLALFGLSPVREQVLRKAAHVTEFFLFSLAAGLFWRGKLPRTLLTAFLAAFLDETIQIFSGRGAQVRDVWIDLAGAAAGSLLGWLIMRRKRGKT